jgi:hypothetical protein
MELQCRKLKKNNRKTMGYTISGKRNVNAIEPSCKKTIYNSREDANDMIRHINETRSAKKIHAYKCDVCGFWHLTSRNEKRF